MRRREFLAALCAATAWPAVGRSQNVARPVVGFLVPGFGSGSTLARLVNAFGRGLAETGFVDGQNVQIDVHSAEGRLERLADKALEVAHSSASVMVSPTNVGALALRAANSSKPIVFVVGLDPIEMGLVKAIDRPGGNATGIAFGVSALEPKRLEVLRELLPELKRTVAIVNPSNPNAAAHVNALQTSSRQLGIEVVVLDVRNVSEMDAVFGNLPELRASALLVTSDPFFDAERQRLIDLANGARIPTIYPWRDFADAGGLLSYGNNLNDAVRQAGVYVGHILKGAKPADLPVWVPTKFEFVINLRTAKMLRLAIPPLLLARADEVIE